jgi:hypothetical protein
VSRSPSLELTKLLALSEGWPFATDSRANWSPFWYQLSAGLLLPSLVLTALALPLALALALLLAALPLLQPAMVSRQRIPTIVILEDYAKLSLKKYKPMAALKDVRNVRSGRR